MSNNNPHGHLTQPPQNPSWNPLQIPSYIPRQPQLAHMSNERPMVRSPLTWHAPAPPPDSIYNFMSANHKNLEHQINPLIQPYVRGPSPFDSMDLSLQSSRNSSSPLNKSGHPVMTQHEYVHKQAQQQLALHQQNQQQSHQQQSTQVQHTTTNYPIHNLSTNASAHTQQQQQSSLSSPVSQHSHNMQNISTVPPPTMSPAASSIAATSKYMNTNGSDCDAMLPPPAIGSTGNAGATASGNNNNGASSAGPSPMHYMRESEARLGENYAKMTQMNRAYDNELQSKTIQKPVELVNKDCNYTTMMPSKMPTHQQQVSPKKHSSPLHNYHSQQQQSYNNPPPVKHNGPHTPPTPHSPATNQQSNPATPTNANTHQVSPHTTLMHGNAGVIDYNQLHLQQQTNYTQQQHLQQQQHMSNQAHLHYQHHQHHMQQHHNSQQQQQQQHVHSQQQQHMHHSPMQQQHHSNLINLDAYPNRTEPNATETNIEKPTINDLSAANAHSTTYKYATTVPSNMSNLAASPESESIDSNSNSSESRQRRKRKSSRIVRMSSSERENEDADVRLPQKFGEPLQLGPRTPKRCSNSRSPKASPQQTQRKSPRTAENFSPRSLEQTPERIATTATTPQKATTPVTRAAEDSEPEVPLHSKSPTLENGTGRALSDAGADELDTANKIIKTNNDANTNDSPRTKKQRQALKLRNSEPQANANCALNATTYNENVSTNDNAVLADDLRKEEEESNAQLSTTAAATASAPLSPQSNSRSSSSSSSSSSCSNSSHSSNESKQRKNKSTVNEEDTSAPVVEKENICANPGSNSSNNTMDIKENCTNNENKTDMPLNLNSKQNTEAVTEISPRKSCFEEVEDKLEEMFAGIEDEPIVHDDDDHLLQDTVSGSEVTNDLSLALQLATSNSTSSNIIVDIKKEEEAIKDEVKIEMRETPIRLEGPPPTKAAKKSTMPSPPKAKTPPPQLTMPKRITPPRRRLSTNMDPGNLRIILEDNIKEFGKGKKTKENSKELIVRLDDEQPSTSAAAIAALATKDIDVAMNEIKTLPKKEKARPALTKKRPATTIKKSAKNGKQKQQQQRRKANSSEDEVTPTRETSANADTKYKSPFILVKNDGTISVKNAPTADDDSEKNIKVKKAYVHDRKNIRGLHSSTLSNKYDAVTTDSTWICVFCKRGPHKMGLGDLFGPYIITTDCEEYKLAIKAPGTVDVDDAFINKRKRTDMVQTNQRNLPVVPAATCNSMAATARIALNKKKKKHSNDALNANDTLQYCMETVQQETFLGMCKVSENSYEIWLHENCTIWTNDIFLVGARVMGLDAAVWNSTRYMCMLCAKPGAIICCLQRDCKAAAHVPCAKAAHWKLNEADFKVYCEKHNGQPNTARTKPMVSTDLANTTDAYS